MKKIKFSILLATIILASGCKNYLDVNVSPNNPQKTDAANLLAPILANMERGEWFDARAVGQYAQIWGSGAANNVFESQGYNPGSDTPGEKWRQHYFAIGTNIDLMLEDALAGQKWDYAGVAYAIRAWSWQTSTDIYGEMILKEAWDGTRAKFDYDKQEEVYDEVVRLCNLALTNLNRTDGAVSQVNLARGDYMYYGDRAKWIKFVYGVLAINAAHRSNTTTYNADKVVEYVDKSFANNDDNATIQCNGSSSGDSNFWGPARQNLNSFRQSDYMVKLLDGRILTGSTNPDNKLDPRLAQLLAPSSDGVYRGVEATKGDVNSTALKIPYLWGTPVSAPLPVAGTATKYIFRDNSRGVILTYAQTQFMKAEALFRKNNNSGNAAALAAYKQGITASLDFVSNPPLANSNVSSLNYITPTAKAAYLLSPAVAQTPATLKMSDIMQQKMIASFVYGNLDVWADMRRFKYDTNVYQGFVTPPLYQNNGGKLAYRIRPRYNSEYVWNVDALNVIGALALDYHTKEPWFVTPK
ncbi:MAG: SusD/RagB family nutrient-binding outer membrane lipoprotein [Bacteroidetes bacterium]|nr:SusD/RagB family nutrient-binding outer membrane lipoprotein [Bacteroidota bacterium]MBU1484326.1 SusD/RagB family nutrient-binding outer membrane lipoprotein [Bacteroidota bacterium]MBU2045763.1 SusD/RagB family nutrient-binding outer membrane lipoprotein [Bacteroidota bacterium]MBU2266807.1 SusD/RagB family nutrient-binding outer membrane lipoprotein [Bacteroidota bacterium]MBU2377010.1 SusD/RagB family nutrient-binding outer membrane lipoprotein [Bacteroidota bacterium]